MRATHLLFLLGVSLASALLCAAVTPARPNVIYILADDLGYGDLGCYGQQILTTPNIDRLATEGMRFTQHYSGNTVCAPSRSALLEGKHTGRTAVRGNLPYHLMDTDTPTLGQVMSAAGYRTAIIGKWGVGHPPPLDDPKRHGFEHAYGYINMWHAHNFYPEFLYRNEEKHFLEGNVLNREITFNRQPEGSGVALHSVTFAPYEIEREALEYIKGQDNDQPYFLYLALNQPHNNGEYGRTYGKGGYEVPTYGEYTNRDWPDAEKGFAISMRIIDDTIGNILRTLEETGQAGNTLILFSSDNGPCHGAGHDHEFFDGNGPLRGYKRDLYEGGIRVPLIARWPGKIQPNSQSDHVSAMWDLYPTFCEIAGTTPPDDLDGISFLPTLLNQGEQTQHDYLYWEFHNHGGKQAIRQGKWKAVHLNVTDPEKPNDLQLFNLETDLGEQTNLATKHPKIAKRLQKLMTEAHTPHPVMHLYPTERPR